MTFDIKNYKIVNQVSGVTIAQYLDSTITETEYLAAGFFNSIANQLAKGSVIIANSTTGTIFLAVTAVGDNSVTVSKALPKATNPEQPAMMSMRNIPGFPLTHLTSTIQAGDIGGSVICTLEEDTFIDAIAAQNQSNWIIDTGSTGLVLNEIVYVDEHNARLVFTGTAKKGQVQLAPKTNALVGDTRYTCGIYEI